MDRTKVFYSCYDSSTSKQTEKIILNFAFEINSGDDHVVTSSFSFEFRYSLLEKLVDRFKLTSLFMHIHTFGLLNDAIIDATGILLREF